MSIRFRAEK